MNIADIPRELRERLRQGCVIPAHPLALTAERKLSVRHQKGLARYYCDAGAGGIAVGVHSTQFEIREPAFGLYEPVLTLASETIDAWSAQHHRAILKIAGVCGPTPQAVREAGIAASRGYHACLLSLSALRNEPVAVLLQHCREVASVMPLVGFYLQPAVGGMLLPYAFWREFAALDNVLAIKMAPFNRYQTLDVVRGVCEAGRERDVLLYTGNDDNIVVDLLSEYVFRTPRGEHRARIVGGLLGHWSVWTRNAVEQLADIRAIVTSGNEIPPRMLTLANEVTDSNAAFFDPAHGFRGCLAGINAVLHRRGQVPSIVCLSEHEKLSPGQMEEIERVYRAYPHLHDDAFVAEHIDTWLRD